MGGAENLVELPPETSEQLEWRPSTLFVVVHVRKKYARKTPVLESGLTLAQQNVVVASKPPEAIPGASAGPGLMAQVIVSKGADHLPLHRLEGIFRRQGVRLSRQTMDGWWLATAEFLQPLHALAVRVVLASHVVHTDDTSVRVRDAWRKEKHKGYFWPYVGDALHPLTVFDYTASHQRDGPAAFLKDYQGYVQADAFNGYDGIYLGSNGRIIEVACWAHARRKFYEARHSDPAGSTQALAYVKLLYGVEQQARQSAAKTRRDLVSERHRLRQELAVPRLAQFRQWLQSQPAERGGSVLPKSPLGQAIQYTLNQWEALCVYATDGRLAIDNNAAENALRRVAVGRKNWLFCGSDHGGRTAATLFSLIATCQRHQVEPMAYLRDVLTRIAAIPVSQLATLLPDRWQAAAAD